MGAGSVNRSLRKPGDMKAILCTRGQHADGSLPQGPELSSQQGWPAALRRSVTHMQDRTSFLQERDQRALCLGRCGYWRGTGLKGTRGTCPATAPQVHQAGGPGAWYTHHPSPALFLQQQREPTPCTGTVTWATLLLVCSLRDQT